MATVMPEFPIAGGVVYVHTPKHRNGSPGASQWSINMDQERLCFQRSLDSGWLDDDEGWGLHHAGPDPQVLGRSADNVRDLYIAKFVGGTPARRWHGYPIDHQRSPSDIPSMLVLRSWLDGGLLRPVQIRRLARGQPCGL
jgi:hypothetical protein